MAVSFYVVQSVPVQKFLGQTALRRMQEYIFIRAHAAFDGEALEASDIRNRLEQNPSVQCHAMQ